MSRGNELLSLRNRELSTQQLRQPTAAGPVRQARLLLGVWPAGPTAPPISAPLEKVPQPPGLRNDTRTEGHLGVGVLRMQGRR